MVDGIAKTPRYVLKDDLLPTGPVIARVHSVVQPTVVFGFSDKPEFDKFIAVSSRSLMPYPLIKGYLQNRIEKNCDSLNLIVLDATSDNQETLYAAEFRAVLDAMQQNLKTVVVSHCLRLDESSSEYCISAIAEGSLGTADAVEVSDRSSDLHKIR